MFDKYQIPREKIRQLEALLASQDIDGLLLVSREGGDPILRIRPSPETSTAASRSRPSIFSSMRYRP